MFLSLLGVELKQQIFVRLNTKRIPTRSGIRERYKSRKEVCGKGGGAGGRHVRYLLIDYSLRRIVFPSTLPKQKKCKSGPWSDNDATQYAHCTVSSKSGKNGGTHLFRKVLNILRKLFLLLRILLVNLLLRLLYKPILFSVVSGDVPHSISTTSRLVTVSFWGQFRIPVHATIYPYRHHLFITIQY